MYFIRRRTKKKNAILNKIEEKINIIQKNNSNITDDKITTYDDIIFNVRQSILMICKFFHFSFNEVNEQDYDVFLQELLFIYDYNLETQKEIDKNKKNTNIDN